MPRPPKCRRICHFPETLQFSPPDVSDDRKAVILTLDEYEAIRLIDREGCDQEQCAAFMQIARTTVQRIYESARKKLAECIVEGRPLRIEGGDFRLCNGQNANCGYNKCYKQFFSNAYKIEKGASIMRIAVTYENGEIFQHFGHTRQFKIYDVQDGVIVSSQVVDTNGSGHGALAGILNALNADVLICGGIGGSAQAALAAANIKLYGGISGSADEAAQALVAGALACNPVISCSHHNEHHGGEHTCGSHGCGEHHGAEHH